MASVEPPPGTEAVLPLEIEHGERVLRVFSAIAALGRQALHADLLGFVHAQSGARLRFESPLPGDLAALERALGAL